MNFSQGEHVSQHNVLILTICLLLSAGVFTLDLNLYLGLAIGIAYCPVVLLASRTNAGKYPLYIAALACLLIILGHYFSTLTRDPLLSVSNRAFSVALLILFTSFLYRKLHIEASLAEALQQLKFHVSNSPMAVIEWDADFKIKTWSTEAEKIFGWQEEEVRSLQPLDWQFIHRAERQRVDAIMAELVKGEKTRNTISNRNYTKDGKILHIKWHNSVLRNKEGKLISILSLAEDCSEAIQVEEGLRKSEAYAKAVLETAIDAIITFDSDGAITSANPAVEKIFGLRQDELLGKSTNILVPEHYHTEHRNYLSSYFHGDSKHLIGQGWLLQGLRKDGQKFPMEVSVSEVIIENRHSFTAIIRDITEKQRAQVALETHNAQLAKQEWLQSGLSGIVVEMRGDLEAEQVANKAISFICRYVGAQTGTCYLSEDEGRLVLRGRFAYYAGEPGKHSFAPGEGLPGQAVLEKQALLLDTLPDDYLVIKSSLGEAKPANVFIVPFFRDDAVQGVLEIGKIAQLNENEIEFIKLATDSIGVAIHAAQTSRDMKNLLLRLQNQSLELTTQSQELKSINKALEQQTSQLRRSETDLTRQREELKAINERLKDKTLLLNAQKEQVEMNNTELEETRRELEYKAAELEQASLYKSQFLANMSHELRTPLNSMLVLAQSLNENADGNLSDEETKCAYIIHKSGKDLLKLINDILDLSKVEAGQLSVEPAPILVADMLENMNMQFSPIASDKNIAFSIELDDKVPAELISDEQRLLQILRNLLSNAFKFTERGIVKLDVSIEQNDVATAVIKFKVTDTGEGIHAENQKRIFEAFQQVDGSTSRKHGGTGLGLSISRDLAKLLGGNIELQSEPGVGSTFILTLPSRDMSSLTVVESNTGVPVDQNDNRNRALIVSDEKKSTPAISAADEADEFEQTLADIPALSLKGKSILVVDDDVRNSFALCRVLKRQQVEIKLVENGEAAIKRLKQEAFDIVLMDMMMPVMDGYKAIQHIRKELNLLDLPIIALTANAMREDRKRCLESGADAYLSKPVDVRELFHLIRQCLDRKSDKAIDEMPATSAIRNIVSIS